MRPIHLEMTAFGSYAAKTAVPFDGLKHGLYLVTGDTGAGKTTVFDAIMFALYGVASGPDRTPDMMHCDFVEKSVDTVVTLRFQQSGKQYEVTRTIHYPKKRGIADRYGNGIINAVLTEPDRAPTEGAGKVTARCTELLGLNAEQFRKIVMLAQGEFREFLKADSDKKNEILGKLFDSTPYVRFQNLLGGARDALRSRHVEQQGQLDHIMKGTFLLPENIGAEERNRYLPENPQLIEHLTALTTEDETQLQLMEQQRERLRTRSAALAEQKGGAEANNRLLNELSRMQIHLTQLEGQRPQMERLQTDCDTVERVLRQVQPKADKLDAAEQLLTETKSEIAGLQAQQALHASAVETAQSAVDADGARKTEIIARNTELQTIQNVLPQFDELSKQKLELEAAERAAKETEKQKTAVERQWAETTDRLEEIGRALASLEGIDAEAVALKNDWNRAQTELDELNGENGICKQVKDILQQETDLKQEQDTLRTLTQSAIAAERHHHSLYQAFFSGQAGLLAGDLERELAENGKAVCPVCHSEFCAGEQHRFAPLVEGTPTSEEVDTAKQAYDSCEKKRGLQERKIAEQISVIRGKKEQAVTAAGNLLPGCASWDQLTAEHFLANAVKKFTRRSSDAGQAYDDALQKLGRKKEFKQQQESQTAVRKTLDERLQTLTEQLQKQLLAVEALDAAVKERQKHLPYPDQASADAQYQRVLQQRDKLTTEVEEHQKTLDADKEQYNTTTGNLAGKQGALPGLEQAKTDARLALNTALAENGFAAIEEAQNALRPIGDKDGEQWLKEKRAGLTDYDNDCKNTADRVETLKKQTENLRYTDLDALQTELDEVNRQYNTANAACARGKTLLDNHRHTLEQAAAIKSALEEMERPRLRLERLANLAVGVNGEGGRLSFDRYVMGAVFRDILEMANRRLVVMSGGKYELVHQVSADRRNAKAGLDIEVLDVNTGKQRDSASLSGGESFLVSLALALGLSDVVQNHAGGKQLDALFIDEGFGSLDDSSLDKAITVLNQLTEGNRLVGIISHVSRLEECIPQKLRVKNSEKGSSLSVELS